MARVTVEDCLHQVDNRFALVLLATKRTRQIMAGARTFIDKKKNKGPVVALREIAMGKVHPDRNIREVLMGKYDKKQEKTGPLRPIMSTGPRSVLEKP